jgi:hypothetical protein
MRQPPRFSCRSTLITVGTANLIACSSRRREDHEGHEPIKGELLREFRELRVFVKKAVKKFAFFLLLLLVVVGAAGLLRAQRLNEPFRGYDANEQFIDIPAEPAPDR